MPAGLYLRLLRRPEGGWRLLDRHHQVAVFDGAGRLVERSDRHRQGAEAGERGSTLHYRYDAFGQLVRVEDDLGRAYRFEYDQDLASPYYGLLLRIEDFAGRVVEYEYDEERRLLRVLLPEVENPTDEYAGFSYVGASRPALEYEYDPAAGPSNDEALETALLHGDFAPLRLGALRLPAFLETGSDVPRLRIEYGANDGRVQALTVPTPLNENAEGSGAGSGVRFELEYQPAATAAAAEGATVRLPWGHELEYTLEDGRIAAVTEDLEVVQADGSGTIETVATSIEHTDDGRVSRVTHPDGGIEELCYADGEGAGECALAGAAGGDRLARANVVATRFLSGGGDTGTAPYTETATTAEYHPDNLAQTIHDGLGRAIDLPVAAPEASARSAHRAEGVGATYEYDRFGRPTSQRGDGEGGPQVQLEYGEDASGRAGAGLVERVARGSGAGAFSMSYGYDEQWNVVEQQSSQGTTDRAVYDAWDRAVRIESGLSSGAYAAVGGCEGFGEGAMSERAFDAVGHVVRERRLQQVVDGDGLPECRFVERRYRYNAREQVVEIEQTHLASPSEPGAVDASPRLVTSLEHDEHGRVSRRVEHNLLSPSLATAFRYDDAGRVAGTTVGQMGEQRVGYDAKGRVVLRTDGDVGVWRGRYDVWDRLYREEMPSGAVVLRQYDPSHQLSRETVFDGDPSVQGTRTLADRQMQTTSFGAAARVLEVLEADESGNVTAARVIERVFDESGRVVRVVSGAADANGALDPATARREEELVYEADAGRVLQRHIGGAPDGEALFAESYFYEPDNRSPWFDAVTRYEAIPGQTGLVETSTTSLRRDALGRPVLERTSDGRVVETLWDRSGPAIRTRTGSGAVTAVALDGLGRPLFELRPQGRGRTSYAYDLDGRLLRKSALAAEATGAGGSAETWDEVYAYDSSGRLVQVTHEDGTVETRSYHPDGTVAERTTRDGVRVVYGYDAANRVTSAVPSLVGEQPAHLVPVDAGDVYEWDELGRRVAARRGRSGAAGLDAELAVEHPSFDLGGRVREEVVGNRTPLEWRYDAFGNAVELGLPASLEAGDFGGYARTFDTLNRLASVNGFGGALSAVPLGASWTWAGRDRLLAIDTHGPLGTAARFGYLGGSASAGVGAQSGGPTGDAAAWRLGTLIWGSAGNASAVEPPEVRWGGFGYGWRGSEQRDGDGLKIGRTVLGGSDLGGVAGSGGDAFAGMGWSLGYDAGERLTVALPGAGSLSGAEPGEIGAAGAGWQYQYGDGDQLLRAIEQQGEGVADVENVVTGADGRMLSRGEETFAYDASGRRTEDAAISTTGIGAASSRR